MKVKILESNCTPKLEKTINKYLENGWKISGKLFKGLDCLTIMLYKN